MRRSTTQSRPVHLTPGARVPLNERQGVVVTDGLRGDGGMLSALVGDCLEVQTDGTINLRNAMYMAGTPAAATGALRMQIGGQVVYLACSTNAPI